MRGSPRLLWRAENLEPVPPAHHLTIEILLKDADELIPPSEQTVRFLLILKINDLLHRLFLSQKTNHLHATYRKETTIWNYKPFPLCAQEDGQTYKGWFSHMHGEPTRDIKMPCRSMTHVKSSITAKADGELPDFYDAGRHTKEVLPFLKPPTRRFTDYRQLRQRRKISKPPTRRFTQLHARLRPPCISKPPTRRFTEYRRRGSILSVSKPPTRRFT